MKQLIVRQLGIQKYQDTSFKMSSLTNDRTPATPDEVWFLEHSPVYTLGMAGKSEHILDSGEIPVVKTDRGGQVTYHGPGQLVAYLVVDLKRKGFGIKHYVSLLEQIILNFLNDLGQKGQRRAGAPGVYINGKKIAALGIRVRKGCCYHGLALNVDMDLAPFQNINPCGYSGLEVTQLKDIGVKLTLNQVIERLLPLLKLHLDYESCDIIADSESTPVNDNS